MVEWCIDRGKPKNSEWNLSQCHFVHQKILHGLTRARAWASAVRGRWLTTWAMARPWSDIVILYFSSLSCIEHICIQLKHTVISTIAGYYFSTVGANSVKLDAPLKQQAKRTNRKAMLKQALKELCRRRHTGCSMAEAVRRLPVTAEARVRVRISLCEICGGRQSHTRKRFLKST
jgi:hypothetical protein